MNQRLFQSAIYTGQNRLQQHGHQQYYVENTGYQQQQQQTQLNRLKEKQNEMRYYVFQDMQNLINLIYSLDETINYFNDDPNHQMIDICHNKMILQLNLSNSIHYDLYQNCVDPEQKKELQQAKKEAQQLFNQAMRTLNSSNQQINSIQHKYITQNLSSQLILKQEQLKQINNSQYNFDQQRVQQIIESLHIVDNQLSQLKNMSVYPIPQINETLAKAAQFRQLTRNRLEQNFPKKPNSNQQQFRNQSLIVGNRNQRQNQQNNQVLQNNGMQSTITTNSNQRGHMNNQYQKNNQFTSSKNQYISYQDYQQDIFNLRKQPKQSNYQIW